MCKDKNVGKLRMCFYAGARASIIRGSQVEYAARSLARSGISGAKVGAFEDAAVGCMFLCRYNKIYKCRN